jgi:hypothetical protein
VEHSGNTPLPHCGRENVGSIRFRFSGVDHERESGLSSRIDMGLETLTLSGAVRLVVIIIEAALSDGDYARMVGGVDERRGAKVRVSIGLVWVNSDTSPDVGLTFRKRDYVIPFALAGRNIEKSENAMLPRVFKDFVLSFDQSFVI